MPADVRTSPPAFTFAAFGRRLTESIEIALAWDDTVFSSGAPAPLGEDAGRAKS
jgi:hypothetical protein